MFARNRQNVKAPTMEVSYMDTGKESRYEDQFGRSKPFLKKWWWAILLLSIAIITIIAIFAIIPAVSNSLVTKSMLMIQSLQVLNPSPTAFRLIMNSTLYHATSFSPTLDAFNVSLYTPLNNPKKIAFSSSHIPQLISYPKTNINLDQTAPILDLDQFTDFARQIVTMEELELAVYGKTTLRLGGLPPVSVNFEQTLKLKGLNGLSGFTTTNMRLLAKTATDGSNILGSANIPNPSVMSVALGNMTFLLSVNGTFVGTASIKNVLLVPGNNSFPMRANISIGEIAKNVDLTTGTAKLSVTSNSTVYNGKHLSYFEHALSGNSINTTINIKDIGTNALDM